MTSIIERLAVDENLAKYETAEETEGFGGAYASDALNVAST